MRRRALLRTGVVLPLSGLAGCAGAPSPTPSPSASPSPPDRPDGDSTETTGTPGATGETTGVTGRPGLDLREANVVAVTFDGDEGSYTFDVALHHDDDGEDGYANWWTVETRDGEELGRRELAHAHGTREFTRSETVSVPDDVGCVVVRGHDQTHAYGGQASLVSLASGATRFVTQGNEPWSFADADCP